MENIKLVCKICNKEFKNALMLQKHLRYEHAISSIDYYDRYLKKDKEGLCEVCNKPTKYLNMTKGYRDFCSVKCTRASKRISEKRISTIIEKFGVNNPSQNEDIKKKKIETTKKNYGVAHHLQSSEVKEKIRKNNKEKYGVDWVSKRKEVRDKVKNTCKSKYGVEYGFHKKEVKEKQKENYFKNVKEKLNILGLTLIDSEYFGAKKVINIKCNKCGTLFESKFNFLDQSTKRNMHYSRCPNCYPKLHGDSLAENKIKEFIKSLNIETVVKWAQFHFCIYNPSYNFFS